MGCWIGALGRLTIIPEPTDDLIMEYADFSDHACPEDYNEDEIFKNPWYFDEENRRREWKLWQKRVLEKHAARQPDGKNEERSSIIVNKNSL